MDDKTKNDQQESNEDKDELELFTRNTSKKRRQRKDQKATHFSNQNKMIHLNKLILMKKFT